VRVNSIIIGLVLFFTYELNNWLTEMNIAPANGIEMYASAKTGLSLETIKFSNSELDSGNTPHILTNKKNNLLLDLGILLGARYHFSINLDCLQN